MSDQLLRLDFVKFICSVVSSQRRQRAASNDSIRWSATSVSPVSSSWDTLEHRRQTSGLITMYKTVSGLNSICSSHLLQLSHPIRQANSDGVSFIQLQYRTDAYKYSYFPHTICSWSGCRRLFVVPHHQKSSSKPWTHVHIVNSAITLQQ